MRNLRFTGLFMIILVAMLAISCANDKPAGGSAYANPELWKILKESDWAAWAGVSGCEMKFIGQDKAIAMEWLQDPVTKVWSRTVSDVGTVEFIDENWFVITYEDKSMACLFTKSENTFENSNGSVYRKSQINAFRRNNK
jgi:hypothetical protein